MAAGDVVRAVLGHWEWGDRWMYGFDCGRKAFVHRLTWSGIKYEDLAYTSSYGFAAVGANNGKNGTRLW